MKKLLMMVLLIMLFASPVVFAAPFVYFHWTAPVDAQISDYKIILLGLPGSPTEATFVSASQDDPTYFKAEYDLKDLPDGKYSLTAKIKDLRGKSTESPPYNFTKAAPGGISSVLLDY